MCARRTRKLRVKRLGMKRQVPYTGMQVSQTDMKVKYFCWHCFSLKDSRTSKYRDLDGKVMLAKCNKH